MCMAQSTSILKPRPVTYLPRPSYHTLVTERKIYGVFFVNKARWNPSLYITQLFNLIVSFHQQRHFHDNKNRQYFSSIITQFLHTENTIKINIRSWIKYSNFIKKMAKKTTHMPYKIYMNLHYPFLLFLMTIKCCS